MTQRVVIAGASGLIGTALTSALRAGGWEVRKLVRHAPASGDEIFWAPERGEIGALGMPTAVVQLSGESIAGRWTSQKKRTLIESRIQTTELLVNTLRDNPPQVFVCASAVGFYGDRGSEALTEQSAAGSGFLPELAARWESTAAAMPTRVVNTRFGIVLAKQGGALRSMLLPFRLGLGGPIGSGEQYLSWVSLRDAVAAIRYSITNERLSGPLNVTAPTPVTNRDFAAALGRALRRPAVLPLPAAVIKLLFGEMGEALLLGSTRAIPARLTAAGFRFTDETIDEALANALAD